MAVLIGLTTTSNLKENASGLRGDSQRGANGGGDGQEQLAARNLATVRFGAAR